MFECPSERHRTRRAAIGLLAATAYLATCDGPGELPSPPLRRPVDLNTTLLKQAEEGDVQAISASLKAGADPNYVPDPVGRESPLINAARRGHLAAA